LLSLPVHLRRLAAGAAALTAAVTVSAPAQAASTPVESTQATALNFSQPALELAFNFTRKAG